MKPKEGTVSTNWLTHRLALFWTSWIASFSCRMLGCRLVSGAKQIVMTHKVLCQHSPTVLCKI